MGYNSLFCSLASVTKKIYWKSIISAKQSVNSWILVFELQIPTVLHLAQVGPSRVLEDALSSILKYTSLSSVESYPWQLAVPLQQLSHLGMEAYAYSPALWRMMLATRLAIYIIRPHLKRTEYNSKCWYKPITSDIRSITWYGTWLMSQVQSLGPMW